jgi:hypothetical protein
VAFANPEKIESANSVIKPSIKIPLALVAHRQYRGGAAVLNFKQRHLARPAEFDHHFTQE